MIRNSCQAHHRLRRRQLNHCGLRGVKVAAALHMMPGSERTWIPLVECIYVFKVRKGGEETKSTGETGKQLEEKGTTADQRGKDGTPVGLIQHVVVICVLETDPLRGRTNTRETLWGR